MAWRRRALRTSASSSRMTGWAERRELRSTDTPPTCTVEPAPSVRSISGISTTPTGPASSQPSGMATGASTGPASSQPSGISTGSATNHLTEPSLYSVPS